MEPSINDLRVGLIVLVTSLGRRDIVRLVAMAEHLLHERTKESARQQVLLLEREAA
jgi:hypothetical protein